MPYPCNSHKKVLGPRLLPHFLDEKIGSWELKQTEQRLVSRAIWFHLLLGDSHKKTSLRNSGLSTSIIRYFHPLWGQRKPPLNHGKLGAGMSTEPGLLKVNMSTGWIWFGNLMEHRGFENVSQWELPTASGPSSFLFLVFPFFLFSFLSCLTVFH